MPRALRRDPWVPKASLFWTRSCHYGRCCCPIRPSGWIIDCRKHVSTDYYFHPISRIILQWPLNNHCKVAPDCNNVQIGSRIIIHLISGRWKSIKRYYRELNVIRFNYRTKWYIPVIIFAKAIVGLLRTFHPFSVGHFKSRCFLFFSQDRYGKLIIASQWITCVCTDDSIILQFTGLRTSI